MYRPRLFKQNGTQRQRHAGHRRATDNQGGESNVRRNSVRRYTKALCAKSTQGSGTRRGFYGLVCLCVLGLAAFLGSGAPSAGAQACPNEALRTGASAFLPDCRAYELVSPADMEGVQVNQSTFFNFDYTPISSSDGQTSSFETYGVFGEEAGEGSGVANFYLSRRSGSGWSTESLNSPIEPYPFLATSAVLGSTEDLEKSFFLGPWTPPLTPDASDNSSNSYLRDNSNGSYRLVTVGLEPNLGEVFIELDGLAANGQHVVFHPAFGGSVELAGCPSVPTNRRLCDWSAATGELSLVGVKPNGEPSTAEPRIAAPAWRRSISADGARIFFKENSGADTCRGVCVRINAATTQVVGTSGSTFEGASSDGSVAYITQSGDLKRYDVAADELTDLTPGGEVQGVLGTSADGSRVYFVAKGELAPGATPGTNNLYLWTQNAGFEFIASPVTQTSNWTGEYPSSRVTPDGMHVAFTANTSLTGYPDAGHTEAYLYSAATGELACASCNPSGEPAASNAKIDGTNTAPRLPRNLSDDGARLFFTTGEALVPRDSNGLEDIYEYDAASGGVALITTGNAGVQQVSSPGIEFSDASASGNDVTFVTKQSLVGIDTDEGVPSAYDARVDGGIASQNPPPPTPPCTGKECRGETSTPSLAGAASATVVGKGNLSQKQNCNKLGKEAKKLSNRAKRLRKHAKAAKRNGKSGLAKKRNKKANRLAKHARNKSKSAKKCRKRNRGASK
jgi:hypothetical protein